MKKIEKALKNIQKTNYFSAWEDLLVGDFAIEYWSKIFDEEVVDEDYEYIGAKLHDFDVPYVIVSEYIDEIFREMNLLAHDYFHIKNKIANAFLVKKLEADRESLESALQSKLSRAVELKKDLINAHLIWMKKFIDSIINGSALPELDFSKCSVGLWLIEEEKYLKNQTIKKIHIKLHLMAQSALRMYKRKDYAHFLLLYIDILNSSYQIRDFIINTYLSKRFSSIYKDYLSNQPNYFQLQLDLREANEDEVIVLLNIKEFSSFNLLYGHSVGDTLIKEVIDYLLSLEKIQRVYRIYGDVFCVVFKKSDLDYVTHDFKRVLESHEYHVHNKTILLSFYASFSMVSEHALEYCEYGLLESKRKVGTFIDARYIDENMAKKYAKKMTLSQKLKIAFLDDRFICYYQPIMDKTSSKILKYEVLIRMQTENDTVLAPGEFLSVLKDMYIYPEVTKVIIQKSFEFFKDKEYEFSINLSFADIINPETEAFILAIIKQHPDVAKRCSFELLEYETIKNEREVLVFFKLLKERGVQISIDDFGSGFSNYDTIFKFDVDSIKIDGTITESLLTSHKSRVLLDSIITVARELGAKIIVEYVSTKEIYDYLIKLDIDMLQGYYIGRPSPALLEK
jgi:EAL domain-containing protein (putative c-di-GMP-specific phosphodiesterase class I)/GGDEF domain-containing protein